MYWLQIVLKGKKNLKMFSSNREKSRRQQGRSADGRITERRRVPIIRCPWGNGFVEHNGTATGANVVTTSPQMTFGVSGAKLQDAAVFLFFGGSECPLAACVIDTF